MAGVSPPKFRHIPPPSSRPMTRLLALLALGAAALYLLDNTGTLRFSGGSGSSAISGYTSASAPAIKGIVDAAGG